ncbi:hypothetical protein HRbin22_00946 [Candidatus Thermoflexus japonica]|uniref:Uncharacterized protein n=1 Tax=Candidatus Thermoflexus japonica TaxID=2035417 RepID=A0A2H5Y5I5_9CHLR|nr:hypothetical protein HRbin22_00946 [Candidatus Thermoflexus japonica]
MREFLIGPAHAFAQNRHVDLGEDLAGLESGGQHPHKEIIGGDRPLPVGADGFDRGPQGQHRRRVIRRRVRVGKASADGAHVAHRRIPNVGGHLRQEGTPPLQLLRELHLPMGGQRPDDHRAVDPPDPFQLGHTSDVHQRWRVRQAQLHQWDQGVPAGQHLRLRMLSQEVQGLLQSARPVVFKGRRIHRPLLSGSGQRVGRGRRAPPLMWLRRRGRPGSPARSSPG